MKFKIYRSSSDISCDGESKRNAALRSMEAGLRAKIYCPVACIIGEAMQIDGGVFSDMSLTTSKRVPATLPAPAQSVKRLLPWLVAVAFFMESLDTTILNTAVPAIARAL